MTPERTRELLENCAKACGVEVTEAIRELWQFEGSSAWNPLNNSADEAEMEAKLRLSVTWHDDCVEVGTEELSAVENYADNSSAQAARRLAGCRVGSGIGAGMRFMESFGPPPAE